MRIFIGIALIGLALTSSIAVPATISTDAIEQDLRSASSVSFYFVSRTELYDYSIRKIQSEAGVVVKRSCGANCHNFMSPVLDSLRASKVTVCLKGQQDILITFGQAQIVYSYGGRQAMYQGKCYFNQESINQLLKSDGFFFH